MKKLLSLFTALPLVAILMFSTLTFASTGDIVVEGKYVEVPSNGMFYSASYFPDYNETDQGAIGDGRSTKDYIDAISTDSATLVFQHNSGVATTPYQFSTDETISVNINIIIEKGAILNTDLSIRNASYKWTQTDNHTLAYTGGGTHEIIVTDTLTGATSGATGIVTAITLTSGTWAGGDAAGVISLKTQTGNFEAENLNEGANNDVCTVAGNSTQLSEYYLELEAGGNPGISIPSHCAENTSALTETTAGILAVSEWDWADNDGLGYSTVYVRLSDNTDPDSKAVGYVEAGYILTINGPFDAGLYQAFSGVGTVKFGRGSTTEVYPQYWGAKGDNVNDDTVAIQAAFDCNISNIGKIIFPSGVYRTTDEIRIPGMYNVTVEGKGFRGTDLSTDYTEVQILYDGIVDASKAVIRMTAGSEDGYMQNHFKQLTISADFKAGFALVIEGTAGATWVNKSQFDRCKFYSATKIGVLIGDIAGSVDVDSHKTIFNNCKFYASPIGCYCRAQNAYGPYFNECTLADNPWGHTTGYVINHLYLKLSSDFRINNCFFSSLFPATTVTNPITDLAVTDDEIFCVRLCGGGTMSNCLTEESRVLKTETSGSCNQTIELSNLLINDTRDADARSRNLNWNNGAAAYSVYSEAPLVISNCQLGGTTGVEMYRRIYNNKTLSITSADYGGSSLFLGTNGLIIHGANSIVLNVCGKDNSTIITPNHNLSYWQDANTLLDSISKTNGTGGVCTITKSDLHVENGKYTAAVDVTTKSTSYCSGLFLKFRPQLSKQCSLIISGYAATWEGLSVYRSGGISSSVSDGNIAVVYNTATKQFIAVLNFEVDNTYATEYLYFKIGLYNVTGLYYYDTLTIIPNYVSISLASALLHSGFSYNTNFNRSHSGYAAPTVGEWWKGDIVWNISAAAGGTPGWVCTTGNGTNAGTWKAMADLAP